jgi:hypothetical protein
MMAENPNTTDIVLSEATNKESSLAAPAAGTLQQTTPQDKAIPLGIPIAQTNNPTNSYPVAVILYNQTNKRLHIHHGFEEIVIPAFGSKKIALEEVQTSDTLSTFRNYDFIASFVKKLVLRGWLKFSVQWSDEKPAQFDPNAAVGFAVVAIVLIGAAFAIQSLFPPIATIVWGIAITLILLLMVAVLIPVEANQQQSIREDQHFFVEKRRSPFFNFARLGYFWQSGIQWSSLTMTVLISILVPGFTMLFFGGPIECNNGVFVDCLEVFGRIMQFLFIVVTAMLPGLLYFLFDRQRLGVLRKEVERNIFRLDPAINTLDDVHTTYGELIEEFYGSSENSQRLAGGTRTPIVIATLLLSFGMIITLFPLGPIVIDSFDSFYELLLPTPYAFSLGFAGAYFFTMATVIRRYTLGDLQPKTYTHITVRIITVIVLAWVLEILLLLAYGSTAEVTGASEGSGLAQIQIIKLIIAFIIGVVPDTFWTLLREIAQKIPLLGGMISNLKTDDLPLTSISGIDIYERSRLYEEGISNLQGLVHYDIMTLMLKSRIPTARIVDWVDQSILELHLAQLGGIQVAVRERLKNRGIRNTSDFARLYQPEEAQSNGNAEVELALTDIYETMLDDEWFAHIRYWREHPTTRDVDIIIAENGQLQFSERS